MAYNSIGDVSKALDDLKRAARMGSEPAREFLSKQGQNW
jgi:hypothetical protein